MKDLDSLIEILKSNHFYPDTVTKNGKIVALHIFSSPITIDDKMKRVREILNDEYLVRKANSEGDYFEIVKKKK